MCWPCLLYTPGAFIQGKAFLKGMLSLVDACKWPQWSQGEEPRHEYNGESGTEIGAAHKMVKNPDHCEIPYCLSTDALVFKFAGFPNLFTICVYTRLLPIIFSCHVSCSSIFLSCLKFSQSRIIIHFLQELSVLHAVLLTVKSHDSDQRKQKDNNPFPPHCFPQACWPQMKTLKKKSHSFFWLHVARSWAFQI